MTMELLFLDHDRKAILGAVKLFCQHFLHAEVQEGTQKYEGAHHDYPGPEDRIGR